uniref:hypothetical protein n=1 Tax=Amycolatopsis sp. CA-096443 TaxID=3239919 RepID=UPI003F499EC0
MITAVSMAFTAVGIGVSVYFGRNAARQMAERTSVRRFLRVRQVLSRSGPDISRLAIADSLPLARTAAPYVLADRGWILELPSRLDDLGLRLVDPLSGDRSLDRLRALRRYLPVDPTGRRFDRYHDAITTFDQPSLWFDANAYRLVGIDAADPTSPEAGPQLSLRVAASRYWDCFDFAEGLRHEAAHRYLTSSGRTIGGVFRRSLGDPFDLLNRHCGLGFATLTIRVAGSGANFYLHRRGDQVAAGQNEIGLVPSGEFQPSDDSRFALRQDLDIWLAMMREYAEELLNMDEVRQARGAPIDYAAQSPFRELQAARTSGAVRPYLLGIGLLPASWKAQIFTVCVFDAPAFDRIFADMATENREGVLEVPTHHRATLTPLTGWDFTEKTVQEYLRDRNLSPSAKLVLELAWRHRTTVLHRP